jgi:serine/threonine protein kinase
MWSLKQMAGLASGLYAIHNIRTTISLDVSSQASGSQKGVKLGVQPGEEKFGRHGDIKPENLLWFENICGHDVGDQGILQITDFGLGRFHGRDSRTEQPPHNIRGSPTYEPPECQLFRPVSREYDMWSLGCVYLEFVSWLLLGNDSIEQFSEERSEESSLYENFYDDYFFTVDRGILREPRGARIRPGVLRWVQNLHAHERCSSFIHDLLDFIMEKLLVINAQERARAGQLNAILKEFLEKAKDEDYLCRPNPRSMSFPEGNPNGTESSDTGLG